MSYVRRNVVGNDENIREVFNLHPLKLIFKWIWGVLGIWLLFIPTLKAIKYTITYCTTEFVLTERRVIEKYGLFNTHCDEMRLDKIENVTVMKTFWGQIFNYGRVVIQGTNRNNVIFDGVKNPEFVRRSINATIGY